MKIYRLTTVQFLHCTLEDAWEFLSAPQNLKAITPGYLAFDILSEPDVPAMYAGMIIEYRLRPLAGLPVHWVTEITHLQKPHYFVDEQRFGPYSFWHHKHFLRAVDNGVEITDRVDYALGWGILGRIIHFVFVRRRLEKIFEFRRNKLHAIFSHQS